MLKFNAISLVALAGALCLPALAKAGQETSYSYGHIRYIEGEVHLQRSSEPEPEVASINYPVLPGDRAWTLAESRAEVEYADGSLLRLDQRTRVDFVEFGDRDQEAILRVWAGSVFLHLTEEQVGRFRIDTPSGTVYPASAGLLRIDVVEGGDSTVLSVYEGVAELASVEGSVLVRSGQRSIAEPGRRPEPSFPFNTATYDDFASWNDARNSQYTYTERVEGVPPEVGVYIDDLGPHGTWRVDVQLGSVWYPSVSAGWYPYTHGRWSYTPYGQTWISYEPWGWAPYHYGRWGYNHYGWYWIPGAHWGPAWVSWAIGPSWVGWCPLGYHNRPAVYYDSVFHRGGQAVPRGGRGSLVTRTRGHGWNFEGRDHFGRRSSGKARLRTADVRGSAGEARLLQSGAVLDRNLEPRVVGAAAMTRLPRNGAGLRTGSGSLEAGRTSATRRGETRRGLTGTETGARQTGPALSRTGSRTRASDTENRSTLQTGSSRASSSRGRVSTRDTTGPRESERSSDSLSQGTARTGHRTPLPQSSDDSPARSTVRRIFQNPQGSSSNSTNTTSRGRTTVRRPSSSERQPGRTGEQRTDGNDRTSRTDRPATTARPINRNERPQGSTDQRQGGQNQSNLGRSRSRPSGSPARSSSGTATSQSRSGSRDARGRDFYSRFPSSRPSANRPSANRPSTNRPTTSGRPTPSRQPPAVRTPNPRSSAPRVAPPSRPSGGSQATGGARSTRGSAKKKKN